MEKPSIPSGTRDFSPEEMAKRNFIFNTIRTKFQQFGYQCIETPAMENISTLTGKYGEEGDKLLFRILNSGDFLKNVDKTHLDEKNLHKVSTALAEKGLRYDLTVPFARYVVQHQSEIVFPFKRYQIQPVWRADRPQKGRYREFYQCDADVIGSTSLLNEVDLIQLIQEVFKALNINVLLKINNRKILAGIAEYIGHPERIIDITIAIDKLDKIGLEKVNEELINRGLDKESVQKLQPVLQIKGDFNQKISQLKEILSGSELGAKGIEEIEFLFHYISELKLTLPVELDLTLARGLNYYTGAIFEVKAIDVQIGSISGGGRYDDLTGIFGLNGVSGVGISFGADRIYDVMEQLGVFPESASGNVKLLFVNFGDKEALYCAKKLMILRNHGISCELYPAADKMKKQMSYADKKQIPYVVLAGENEIVADKLTLKNMLTGEQQILNVEELCKILN